MFMPSTVSATAISDKASAEASPNAGFRLAGLSGEPWQWR